MSDSYQAIYDAVRSRIQGGDICGAVEHAIRDANISHYVERAFFSFAEEFGQAALEYKRPCVLFRPTLSIDGNQWCALYGENRQDGVAGFGDTPYKAMIDFDIQWLNAKAKS